MDTKQFTTTLKDLKSLFDARKLEEMARSCGFCRRIRQVHPLELIISLITAMASGIIRSCADLLRRFNEWTEHDISYRSMYNQLSKPEFPEYMRQVVNEMISLTQHHNILSYPRINPFSEFSRIVIQDGSSFAVSDGLVECFPGRFRNRSPAAIEVHATLELLSGQPSSISVAPDTVGERDFLPSATSLAGCLFLQDRGYFNLLWLQELDHAGGYFIARADDSLNPTIISGQDESGSALSGVANKKLQHILATGKLPKRKRFELVARWKINKVDTSFRLIFKWCSKEKRYSLVITNLPTSEYPIDSVSKAYRLRWQIEILFKEWKSFANLHKFDTECPNLAEGLVWCAIAAAIYKRMIANAAQLTLKVEISTQKVAMSCGYLLINLARSLIQQKLKKVERSLRDLVNYLSKNATRSHPKRDRRSGRLSTGLIPVGVS